MPTVKKELTHADIRAARSGDVLRDSKVPGLMLRCFPNRKSWYLYYRTSNGTQRKPKIADLSVMSLSDARKEAKTMLADVAKGGDPSKRKSTQKHSPTLIEYKQRYMREHGSHLKSSKEHERIIDKDIIPFLGKNTKVIDIEYDDCKNLHDSLADKPYMANRVLEILSTMMNKAEMWKIRDPFTNPCRFVTSFKEYRRKRTAKPEEAIAIGQRLTHYAESRPDPVLFLWLLIFTGARPSEIARATFDDLQGSKIVLKEHKTDNDVDDRVIYLPSFVMSMIEKRPRTTGTIVGIKSPKKLWDEIRAEVTKDEENYPGVNIKDLRMYDLKRTFASIGLSHGNFNLTQLGELFNHRNTQTTDKYSWLVEDKAGEIVEQNAVHVEKLFIRGPKGKPNLKAV